jgi:hypothetical protein
MRRTQRERIESGMPQRADLDTACRHFADGPISDSRTAARLILFDHLIGGRGQIQRDVRRDPHCGELAQETLRHFRAEGKTMWP